MAKQVQVRKIPCYDVDGYEFYPIRNYDMHSDDWFWVPEEYESVFIEKGPFVRPEFSADGTMIGYSYLLKPQVSQELMIGVLSEIVQGGYVATTTAETGSESAIAKFLEILNPTPVEEVVEENEENSSDEVESDSVEEVEETVPEESVEQTVNEQEVNPES